MFLDETVDKIFINYQNLPKIDINIAISKLEEQYFYTYHYFAYEVETNIKNISNLLTEEFLLDFKNGDGKVVKGLCYFKKAIGSPFYLLCNVDRGNFSLCEIKKEIIIDNIHYKYNFHIQPVKNNDTIYIEGDIFHLDYVYAMQKTLDFSTNDEIKLDFAM